MLFYSRPLQNQNLMLLEYSDQTQVPFINIRNVPRGVLETEDIANVNEDKIISDRYYCINSTQTKGIMVHYILQPHHIFIHVKVLILCSFLADLSFSLLPCSAWFEHK